MKKYISNLFKSGSQFVWALIAGRRFPTIFTHQGDVHYVNLSLEVFEEYYNKACDKMEADGITYKDFYVKDFFDCVEFGRVLFANFAILLTNSSHVVKGKGIPVDLQITNLKDRGPHAIFLFNFKGKVMGYEVYPEYRKKLNLSTEEVAGLRPINY